MNLERLAIFRSTSPSFLISFHIIPYHSPSSSFWTLQAHHVLRISPIGVSKLGFQMPAAAEACHWRHAAVANGVIYAMPWEATSVLRIDTSTSSLKLLGQLPLTNQGKFGFTVAAQEREHLRTWFHRIWLFHRSSLLYDHHPYYTFKLNFLLHRTSICKYIRHVTSCDSNSVFNRWPLGPTVRSMSVASLGRLAGFFVLVQEMTSYSLETSTIWQDPWQQNFNLHLFAPRLIWCCLSINLLPTCWMQLNVGHALWLGPMRLP